MLSNKTILVTSGTGSFGHTFVPMFVTLTEAQQCDVVAALRRLLG